MKRKLYLYGVAAVIVVITSIFFTNEFHSTENAKQYQDNWALIDGANPNDSTDGTDDLIEATDENGESIAAPRPLPTVDDEESPLPRTDEEDSETTGSESQSGDQTTTTSDSASDESSSTGSDSNEEDPSDPGESSTDFSSSDYRDDEQSTLPETTDSNLGGSRPLPDTGDNDDKDALVAIPTVTPVSTTAPTVAPTKSPTILPTATVAPTKAPTPTTAPTVVPTKAPAPTVAPTAVPTVAPPPISNRYYAPAKGKNGYEPAATKVINNSVPGYEISTYGNPTQADINHWVSMFKNVPEWVKPAQTIRVIIVEGNAGSLYYGGGTWGSILGFTYIDSAAIYVSGNTRHSTSAIHETAHVLDFYSGYHSYNESFISIYNAEKNSLPQNLKQDFNTFEFFAEGIAQYVVNNAAVKSGAPRFHAYITALKG